MELAVLGAGNGGLAAASELMLTGHEIRLWNRSEESIAPLALGPGIRLTGVLGEATLRPKVLSTDIEKVCDGVEAILVFLPTSAHRSVAQLLASVGQANKPIILAPGHTGGALEVAQVLGQFGEIPPLAELSTLPYVVRKIDSCTVSVTGRARKVHAAALPGGESALNIITQLYDCAVAAPNVLVTGLSNVNMVLHPPGAIMGAAWIEAKRGNFNFYVEGLTDGVGRVMQALDQERLAVAASFDIQLPDLVREMQAIGTIEAGDNQSGGLAEAVRSGAANSSIKAPDSLSHRYYIEDIWFGLMPFIELARATRVDVPIATSLVMLGQKAVGPAAPDWVRDAAAMGIKNMCRDDIIALVSV